MRWTVLLCCAGALCAQTTPKPQAADYDAHGRAPLAEIGAEYMVHSFSDGEQTFLAKDFLVVEVALYPMKQNLAVNLRDFSLRLSSRGPVLHPVAPQQVASALTHPDFGSYRGVEVDAGMGNTGVILGGPPRGTVPGQRTGAPPTPPRVPGQEPPGGISQRPPVKAEELVIKIALREGDTTRPVSGFLYFPYKGKSASLKSIELVYDDAIVKLK